MQLNAAIILNVFYRIGVKMRIVSFKLLCRKNDLVKKNMSKKDSITCKVYVIGIRVIVYYYYYGF